MPLMGPSTGPVSALLARVTKGVGSRQEQMKKSQSGLRRGLLSKSLGNGLLVPVVMTVR